MPGRPTLFTGYETPIIGDKLDPVYGVKVNEADTFAATEGYTAIPSSPYPIRGAKPPANLPPPF
jgi:hypothetical protein